MALTNRDDTAWQYVREARRSIDCWCERRRGAGRSWRIGYRRTWPERREPTYDERLDEWRANAVDDSLCHMERTLVGRVVLAQALYEWERGHHSWSLWTERLNMPWAQSSLRRRLRALRAHLAICLSEGEGRPTRELAQGEGPAVLSSFPEEGER